MRNKNFKNDVLDNMLYLVAVTLIVCFFVLTVASVMYA